MEIKTAADINGVSARALRNNEKMSQEEFWASVKVSQPAGSQYEGGQKIPGPVRELIFLKYVAGLKVDTNTVEGAQQARDLIAGKTTKEQ